MQAHRQGQVSFPDLASTRAADEPQAAKRVCALIQHSLHVIFDWHGQHVSWLLA